MANLSESLMQDEDSVDSNGPSKRSVSLSVFTEKASAGSVQTKSVILLELITRRVMLVIISCSFLFFVLCQYVDLQQVFIGLIKQATSDRSAKPCPAGSASQGAKEGCFVSQQVWHGEVDQLENIISVELDMTYTNVSRSLNNTVPIPYSVELWACFQQDGCSDNFAINNADNVEDAWHSVLTVGEKDDPFYLYIDTVDEDDDDSLPLPRAASAPIFNLTFQNQESIPTNGAVKSYYCSINFYMTNQEVIDAVTDSNGYGGLLFSFDVTNRQANHSQEIISTCLCFITIGILCMYTYVLKTEIGWNWMPEQIYCAVYFVILVFFQNPVYIYLSLSGITSTTLAYVSYLCDRVSQAAFLVLWLMFADMGRREERSSLRFYLPKLFFGAVFTSTSVIMVTYQFPSITQVDTDRSSVEAVDMWPNNTKNQFVGFSVAFLFMFWFWAIWWLFTLVSNNNKLKKLPYMQTRYMQLSFRFFYWQATLVFLYYIIQYSSVMFLSFSRSNSFESLSSLTDELSTLWRQQTHLFGKILFLTVYAALLAYCYLPSGVLESPHSNLLTSSYIVPVKGLNDVVVARQSLIRHVSNMNVFRNLVAKAKAEIYCVELALDLLRLSKEAYYDANEGQSVSSSGPMTLEDTDYTLVDTIYDPEVETYCLIAKHKKLKRLVISFRGSVHSLHWKNNLDYGKEEIDLASMVLNEVDRLDGLDETNSQIEINKVISEALESKSLGPEVRSSMHRDKSIATSVGADDLTFHTCNSFGSRFSDTSDPPFTDDEDDGNDDDDWRNRSSASKDSFVKTTKIGLGGVMGKAMNATRDFAVKAAKNTPILNKLVLPRLHKGFWTAYKGVREEIHTIVRQELKKEMLDVYCTGHSLGGALSTFLALDLALNTRPRVERYHNRMSALHFQETKLDMKIGMYSFGTPKVGNSNFCAEFNRHIPDAFRTKVQGDLVANMPPIGSGYDHVGTECIIDKEGYGSVIIDPSFVEIGLIPSKKIMRVQRHYIDSYRKGLEGIIHAYYISNNTEMPKVDSVDAAETGKPMQSISKEMASSDILSMPTRWHSAHSAQGASISELVRASDGGRISMPSLERDSSSQDSFGAKVEELKEAKEQEEQEEYEDYDAESSSFLAAAFSAIHTFIWRNAADEQEELLAALQNDGVTIRENL